MSDLSDLSPTARDALARAEETIAAYPAAVVTDIPDDGSYDCRLTDQHVITAQVCTRLTDEEAAQWLTTVRPPGTETNRWYPSEHTAPVACEQFPDTHRHVIVEC
jgi:hypothetical protein